jgi:hypothetical protein
MNYLEIWCNLKDTSKDLEFANNIANYLNHLKENNLISDWKMTRRKFGFGPRELGEFNISIQAENLSQLDMAFSRVALRDEEIENLHYPVYSMAKDVLSALYRDFPDPERV